MANSGVCQRCGSNKDVIGFTVGEDHHELCADCRKLLTKAEIGRPSIGVTKKVSITLPEEDWEWIDKQGKRSETFRELVRRARGEV